jgi:hypothetical protein
MLRDKSTKVSSELEEKSSSLVAETGLTAMNKVLEVNDQRLTHDPNLPSDGRQANRIYFVYVDWTTEAIPRAFYVGMGDKHRIGVRDRNRLWKRVAAKHGWRREVLLATKSKAFAYDQEIELIAELKTYHYNNEDDWGCNFTRGGDGSIGGYKHNAVYYANHTGSNHPQFGKPNPKLAELNARLKREDHPRYGAVVSAETRAKIGRANRIAQTGKKQALATVQKRSGENNARALLTWNDVNVIRARHAAGETCQELATVFHVKTQTIYKIVTYRAWKLIQPSSTSPQHPLDTVASS